MTKSDWRMGMTEKLRPIKAVCRWCRRFFLTTRWTLTCDKCRRREEWAEVQNKAGLRQSYCRKCYRWFFPQESHDCEVRANND